MRSRLRSTDERQQDALLLSGQLHRDLAAKLAGHMAGRQLTDADVVGLAGITPGHLAAVLTAAPGVPLDHYLRVAAAIGLEVQFQCTPVDITSAPAGA